MFTFALCFAPQCQCALLEQVYYAADQYSPGHLVLWEVEAVNGLFCAVIRQGNPGSDGPPGRDGATGIKVKTTQKHMQPKPLQMCRQSFFLVLFFIVKVCKCEEF